MPSPAATSLLSTAAALLVLAWWQSKRKADRPSYARIARRASAPTTTHRPKRLILVRHGESEGNVDHTIYAHTPDNALHLTELGWQQALCAGRELKQILGDELTMWYVSPYVRTRETLHAIAHAFGGLRNLHWKEDPRIREQDFSNFQCPDTVQAQKLERRDFGTFYYRFPDGGESCADVYDRVSSFMETLYRHWDEHCPTVKNYVLVIHGVTISVFLMRFFKYSVDEFNSYENFKNCEFAVLERNGDHGCLDFSHCVRNESLRAVVCKQRETRPEHQRVEREMRMQ